MVTFGSRKAKFKGSSERSYSSNHACPLEFGCSPVAISSEKYQDSKIQADFSLTDFWRCWKLSIYNVSKGLWDSDFIITLNYRRIVESRFDWHNQLRNIDRWEGRKRLSFCAFFWRFYVEKNTWKLNIRSEKKKKGPGETVWNLQTQNGQIDLDQIPKKGIHRIPFLPLSELPFLSSSLTFSRTSLSPTVSLTHELRWQ